MSDYILINGTLYHHGILGQKWGIRRYQNEDGSLTTAGREHYGYGKGNASSYSKKQAFKDAKKEYQTARKKSFEVIRSESKKNLKDQSDSKMDKAFNAEREARKKMKEAKKLYKGDTRISKAEQKAWRDQRRDYIRTKSVGERLATGLLLGPFGLYNYNSLMASGKESSKFVAFGKSYLVAMTTGGIGNAAYSTIIANKEKEKY